MPDYVLESQIKISGQPQATAELQKFDQQLDKIGPTVKQSTETANAGLSSMEKAISGTRTTIGGLDQDMTVFGKNVGSANDVLNAMGINIPITPMAAFGQVVKAGTNFVKESVTAYADYAAQVRQLRTEIGATPEEASKLIQVADDMGVEFGQLETALKAAIRKGIQPTSQGLGQLSDDYLKLQPGIERTKFLMDTFGRSGADLARLMELGSAKIDEMGASIEGTSMLMSQEGLDAAEEYRVSLDQLDDSFTQIKLTVGGAVIPVLNEWINVMLKVDAASKAGTRDGGAHNIMLRSQIEATIEAEAENKKFADGYEALTAAMAGTTLAQAVETAGTWAAIQANRYHIDTILASTTAVDRDAEAKKRATMATYEFQKQLMRQRNEMLLATGLAGEYQAILDEQTTTTVDLTAQHAELTAELEKLQKQGYQPASEKIQDVNAALLENETAQLAAEEATRKATAQFIYQKVAATLDATASLELAKAMGLISAADYDLMIQIAELTVKHDLNRDGMIDATEAAGGYTSGVLALYAAAELAAGVYEITFNVSVKGDQIPDSGVDEDDEIFDRPEEEEEEEYDPEDPGAPRQHGGPVMSGYPYLVGEAGPEVFLPHSAGIIIPNDRLAVAGSDTFNIIVYPPSGASGTKFIDELVSEVERRRRMNAMSGASHMGTH